jgi:predicted DNA-binding protein with PD1-like motif
MKLILQDSRRYMLRFDLGEDFLTVFSNFLTAEKITAATFTAIGTAAEVELAYFDLTTKQYNRHKVNEDLEILSLIGNISVMGGRPAVHTHGSFSKSDFSLVGGHVVNFTVGSTCELHLIVLSGQMERANNPELNLNLLL